MVKERYAQDFAGGPKAVGDFLVLGGRNEAAGRVVVGDENGAGAVGDGFRVDFSGMDNGPVDEPDGDDADGYHVVCAVEGATKEAFLLVVVEVPDELPGVFRAADAPFPDTEKAPAQLKRSYNPACPGMAETRNLGELFDLGDAGTEVAG